MVAPGPGRPGFTKGVRGSRVCSHRHIPGEAVDADLERELDLTAVGFGTRKLGWMLNLLVLNHIGTETGEISVLKGIQGAKGYPF
jgi:hypothetical protein